MVNIIFLFLFIFQSNTLVLNFVDSKSLTLYDDLVAVTVLSSEETDKGYYESKTYFTVEGYLVLPHDKNGTNVIISSCSNTLYFYILPYVKDTSFIINSCDDY